MTTKLTLTMDKSVIEAAKRHAKEQERSLSNLIETYLRAITRDSTPNDEKEEEEVELSPIVKSLMGSVKVPESFDYKEELYKALAEKYL